MKAITKKTIIGLVAAMSLPARVSAQDFWKRSIQTETEIDATSEQVWTVLSDFENYANWNPFIQKISGELEVDARLNVEIKPADKSVMGFSPRLLVVKPQRELRWLGRVLLPRIFDGEHYFSIERISENKVRFIQGEQFGGLLVPLLWNSMEQGTIDGFVVMNESLKKRVEQHSTPGD